MQRIANADALARGGVGCGLPGHLRRAGAHPTGTPVVIPSDRAARPELWSPRRRKINAAATVTCSSGPESAGPAPKVLQLADTVHAPVGHSLAAKEWIQYENPSTSA